MFSGRRGQTEPLAALVAVSALIVGVGLYGLYITETLPGATDRTTETTAVSRIKDDIETDGVVSGDDRALGDDIETASLPHGRNVYVQVTIIEDGRETVVADAFFGTDGRPDRDPIESGELEGPPAEAGVAERPVAVETRPGSVRGGTLTVGVWDG
ncbi:hypothetical protein C489_09261 [Natrinema versiforme JCM 10478]|uniref:Uncharacterized protein n=2 Tax=Natrinema versiforme TaxID=88724 RepID=L9Y1Y6_9EURY|nr:hypothetical protein C489_09261 [Natrinema versiforme JCM 10478]